MENEGMGSAMLSCLNDDSRRHLAYLLIGSLPMSPQMNRLLQILLMLPRAPRFMTTEDIRLKLDNERIKISLRGVQRDMDTLQQAFGKKIGCEHYPDTRITIIEWQNKYVRWFWSHDAPIFKLVGLNINQAITFNLLQTYLKPLIPEITLNELKPFFAEATSTLDHFDDNPIKAWPNKVAIVQPSQPLIPPAIDNLIHKTVSEALLFDRQLQIGYKKVMSEIAHDYRLNPLGLVLRNGTHYLVASKIDTQDFRIFALHRMHTATILDTLVLRPEGFNLQRFIDEGHMGFALTDDITYQPVILKAIFDPIVANHLTESRLSEDQRVQQLDREHYLITATVRDTEQLLWWLQSFGSRVEVLEPQRLRQKMGDAVMALAQKYQRRDLTSEEHILSPPSSSEEDHSRITYGATMDYSMKTYQKTSVCHFSKAAENWGEFGNMTGKFGFRLTPNGPLIPSTENLYQAMRFTEYPDIQELVIGKNNGLRGKWASKPYRKTHTRADFDECKVEIMMWCLRLKLANHPIRFGCALLATGHRDIVEESKKDDWWGAKPTQDDHETLYGVNVLGQLMMELRDFYRTCLDTNNEDYKRVPPPDIENFTLLGEAIPTIDKR